LLSQAYLFPTAKNFIYALKVYDHKITNASCRGGVITVSTNPQNIMPGFRMLAFMVWRGEVLSNTLESFLPSLQNPILNKFELTHTLKTAQKSCLENFEINMKIN